MNALRILAYLTSLIIVSGCESQFGILTSPNVIGGSGGSVTLSGHLQRGASVMRPIRLEPTAENAFECSAVSAGPSGPRHSRVRMPGAHPYSPWGMELGHFEYVRWDPGTRKKQLEISCVTPITSEVLDQAKAFARGLDPRTLGSGEGTSTPSLVVGDTRASWNGADIECYYWSGSPDSVTCQGQTCTEWAMLRADFDELASLNTYSCPNGCEVYRNPWAYWCPPSESGGDVIDYSADWEGGGGSGNWIPADGVSDRIHACPDNPPHPLCDLRDADSLERVAIQQAINSMPDSFKNYLQPMFDDGRIRVWTNAIVDSSDMTVIAGDVHAGAAMDPYARVHIWKPIFGGYGGQSVKGILCHEAVHAMYRIKESPQMDALVANCMVPGS